MNAIDPIELIAQLRQAEPPPLDSAARDALRQRALGGSRPQRPPRPARHSRRAVRAAIAGALVLALSVAVVFAVASRPGGNSQEAMAAAVVRLADVAEHQRPLGAKLRKQWVVSFADTRTSWTQHLTQARLDQLTANATAIINLRNSGHMGRAVYDKRLSKRELARQKRLQAQAQARADAPVLAGVKIDELPARDVTIVALSRNVAYRNWRGSGGAGGVAPQEMPARMHGGRPQYGSPAQARAARILQRAGIGGANANPTMFGGYESALAPTFDAPQPQRVKSLSSDPARLRLQLTELEHRRVGPFTDTESPAQMIFAAAAAVVSSPYARPAVRAAAIRLIAGLPGVTAAHASDERGRAGLGLSMAVDGGTRQMVFDQSDSRLLGINQSVTDPAGFLGHSYAGGGRHRVKLIAPFDSATIDVSFDPWIVTRGRPICRASFCARKLRPVTNP